MKPTWGGGNDWSSASCWFAGAQDALSIVLGHNTLTALLSKDALEPVSRDLRKKWRQTLYFAGRTARHHRQMIHYNTLHRLQCLWLHLLCHVVTPWRSFCYSWDVAAHLEFIASSLPQWHHCKESFAKHYEHTNIVFIWNKVRIRQKWFMFNLQLFCSFFVYYVLLNLHTVNIKGSFFSTHCFSFAV